MPKKILLDPNEVLKYIIHHKVISYLELSNHFNYSIPTIRNICRNLQNHHPIYCKHGKVQSTSYDISFEIFSPIHENEKHSIAQKAVSYIKDGDTIYLGSGSTISYICNYISHFSNLTIITNSLLIISKLLEYSNITTICLGGIIQKKTLSMTGELSDNFIEMWNISKVFISSEGFDPYKGGYCSLQEKNMYDLLIAKNFKNIYLLVDSSKFKLHRPILWLPITLVDTIISDRYLSNTYQNILAQQQITTVLS